MPEDHDAAGLPAGVEEPPAQDEAAPQPADDTAESPADADALSGPEPVIRTTRRVASHWVVAVLAFVVFAVGGVALVAVQPVEYESTAVLAFQPTEGQPIGADLVTLLAERYPELVSSQGSVADAASAAGVTSAQVSRGMSAAITPLTLNLVISVRLPTATQARQATTSLARKVALEDASDPYLSSVVVAAPSLPERPAGLSRTLLYGLAVVTAAVLATVVAAILAALRPKRPRARR